MHQAPTKQASAARSIGENRFIVGPLPGRRQRGIAVILSPRNLFVYAKLRNWWAVPKGFAASGFVASRPLRTAGGGHVHAKRPSRTRFRARRIVAGAVGGRGGRRHGGVHVLAQHGVGDARRRESFAGAVFDRAAFRMRRAVSQYASFGRGHAMPQNITVHVDALVAAAEREVE